MYHSWLNRFVVNVLGNWIFSVFIAIGVMCGAWGVLSLGWLFITGLVWGLHHHSEGTFTTLCLICLGLTIFFRYNFCDDDDDTERHPSQF